MRVLNITSDDYANLAYQMGECLKAAGVECTTLKLHAHAFGYTKTAPIVTEETMLLSCRVFDVVQIFHSDLRCLRIFEQSKSDANLVVWHTGTPYRSNWRNMNEYFKNAMVICDEASLMHMAVEPRFIHTGIDTDLIKPNYYKSGAYIFAHYPSNKERKGSSEILEALNETGVHYNYSDTILSTPQYYNRLASCDVYIEMLNNYWHGEYGNYGVTATDAAALGKIVITQCLYPQIYEEVYGKCELIFVRTQIELIDRIEWLNNLPALEFLNMQYKTRQWVVKNHGLKATGERLKSIICK